MTRVGSPNALAAGYFLIQHRLQLAQKHIYKVRIWKDDQVSLTTPNMLLYIGLGPLPTDGQTAEDELEDSPEDEESPPPEKKDDRHVDSRFVRRSKDGLDIEREHVFCARL